MITLMLYVLDDGNGQGGSPLLHLHPAGWAFFSHTPYTYNVSVRTDWYWGLLGDVKTDRALNLISQFFHKVLIFPGDPPQLLSYAVSFLPLSCIPEIQVKFH